MTIFLLPANSTDVSSKFGPGAVYPGEESARLIGVVNVLPREQFGKVLDAIAKEGRNIYTPYRPEVLGNASSYDTQLLTRLNHEDP